MNVFRQNGLAFLDNLSYVSPMDHATLITDLGGPTKLAQRLGGIDRGAVYKWRERNSIPRDYWPEVVAVAKADGIAIALDDYFRMLSGRRAKARAAAPKRKPNGKRAAA